MVILRKRDSDIVAVVKGTDRVAASEELRSIFWSATQDYGANSPAGVDWLYRQAKMPMRIFISSLATLFGAGWIEASGPIPKESIRFTRNGNETTMPSLPIPARQRRKGFRRLDAPLTRLSDLGELVGWQRIEDSHELATRLVRVATAKGNSKFGYGLDTVYRESKIPLGTFIASIDQLLNSKPPYLYVESQITDVGLGVKIGRERIVLAPHTVELIASSGTRFSPVGVSLR